LLSDGQYFEFEALKTGKMKSHKNLHLTPPHGRTFLCDVYFPEEKAKGVVVFVHGFKGFKDWGHWEAIAHAFVGHGYVFVKFNLSHNGTTLEAPLDFNDLEAFGHNNYSLEWQDIDTVLNWVQNDQETWPALQEHEPVFLIGHSRGGAISLVKAMDDDRISAVIGWASVDGLDYAWRAPGFIKEWEKNGKYEVENGRTKQIMPLYYQLHEDFQAHADQFDIDRRLPNYHKPILLIHGTEDPAIPHSAAEHLQSLAPKGEIHLIEGADHVFGGRHPFEGTELPIHTKELVETSLNFIDKIVG
jgi:alpha-beta hydrolase superfamily lysophospholipase